jgi:hypothetical protein
MADEVLCLPIYSELKDHEIKKIIEFLKKWKLRSCNPIFSLTLVISN